MEELVLRDFEEGTVIRLGLRLDFGFGPGLRRGTGHTPSGIGAETVAEIETFVPAERVWQFEVDEAELKRADREASKALRDALREAIEAIEAPDAVARHAPGAGYAKRPGTAAVFSSASSTAFLTAGSVAGSVVGLTADDGVAAHLRGTSRSMPSGQSVQSGQSFRSSHAFRSVRTYPQVELRINGQVVRRAIAREEREENDANDANAAIEQNASNDVSGVEGARDATRASAPGVAASAPSSASSFSSSPETPLPAKRFVWILTPVDRLGAPVAAMAYELGTADMELGYRLGSGPWEEARDALELLEDFQELQELEGAESFEGIESFKKPAALADFGLSSAPEAVFRAEPFFLCVPERDSGYVVKLSDLVFERAGKWFVRLEKNETNGTDGKDGSDGKTPDAERDSHSQSSSGSSGSSGSTLKRRIALLERLLRTYEECAHYLRANARFRLVPQSRVDAVEKLRAVTSDTVRYVAEHPDELVPSPNGAGLRIGGRTYLPRHVLVESSAKRFDTYENRAILGVLAALGEELRADAREAAERAEKLRVREPDRPGYVSTASPLAKDAAKRILAYAEALFGLERRRSVLFRDYRTMLPAEPLLVTLTNGRDTLRPTEVFRSIPAYRALFEAISGVQRSEKPVLENEAALLTACGRSRVFELHALFRVLEGLSAAGFKLMGTRSAAEPELERAGRKDSSDRPNRFLFEKTAGDCVAEVLVCYEPVVRLSAMSESSSEGLSALNELSEGAAEGVEAVEATEAIEEASGTQRPEGAEKGEKAEKAEAVDLDERFAVRLARTSVLSPAEGGGLKVVSPEEAFFTPDFVVRVSVRRCAAEKPSTTAESAGEAEELKAVDEVKEAAKSAEATKEEKEDEGARAVRSQPTLRSSSSSSSSPSRWFVADAKYSTRTKTVLERTMDTAYKYLLAMSPTRPGDTLEGVWLFYAWEEARGAFSGNALRTYLPEGLPKAGDVHYECAGLGDGDSSFVRAVLAACEEMAEEVPRISKFK